MKSMDCVCSAVFCRGDWIVVGSDNGNVRARLLSCEYPFQKRVWLESAIQSVSVVVRCVTSKGRVVVGMQTYRMVTVTIRFYVFALGVLIEVGCACIRLLDQAGAK
jgi:hypothetical protein